MIKKFFINKIGKDNLNKDAIEAVMSIAQSNPNIKEMTIEIYNGLLTIKSAYQEINLPNFGGNIKGKIRVYKKEIETYIVFSEVSGN